MTVFKSGPTTKEQADIIQACVDGKTIQLKSKFEPNDAWRDSAVQLFNFSGYSYRVKPVEPREIFVNEYPKGLSCAQHASYELASISGSIEKLRVVRFREVLD